MGRNLGTRVDGAAVQPDARTAGRTVRGDRSCVRTEGVCGVFRSDAALHGRTLVADLVLSQAEFIQACARGNAHLRLHEVDIGDLFRDRVLNLDARVHFDEGELACARAGGFQQELDGSGVLVADRTGELQRSVVHCACDFRVEVRRGGDFDDLLVATLDRAVAFEQVNCVRVVVSKNLDFDVAGPLNGLLNVDGRVAERTFAFAHGDLRGLNQFGAVVNTAHTATAAAGNCLDEQRELHVLSGFEQFVEVSRCRGCIERGNSRFACCGDGLNLVAGHLEHIGTRADEGDSLAVAGTSKFRVLRQEPVTGVNGVCSGFLGHANDLVDVEVRPNRVPFVSDHVRFVSLEAVLRVAVFVGEDGDCGRAEFVGCAECAHRDFTAVGYQDFLEHQASSIPVVPLKGRPPVCV